MIRNLRSRAMLSSCHAKPPAALRTCLSFSGSHCGTAAESSVSWPCGSTGSKNLSRPSIYMFNMLDQDSNPAVWLPGDTSLHAIISCAAPAVPMSRRASADALFAQACYMRASQRLCSVARRWLKKNSVMHILVNEPSRYGQLLKPIATPVTLFQGWHTAPTYMSVISSAFFICMQL